MDVFTLVGKLALEGSDTVNKQLTEQQKHIKNVQKDLKILGAAFTAVGAAGLKMVADARKINSQLGTVAVTTGNTTKELRDLVLETTDVTFGIQSVVDTLEILGQAGLKSEEVLQSTAIAMDRLGDATRSSAEIVAGPMVVAMKTFQEPVENAANYVDKMAVLLNTTTLSMDNFAQIIGYTKAELVDQGLTMDDTIALLALMEARGESGIVAMREWNKAQTEAVVTGKSMAETLGFTIDEVDTQKEAIADNTSKVDDWVKASTEQFSMMDKVKQKWSELTLKIGSALTPLEGVFAAMTAAGPVMLSLSITLPKVAVGFHKLAEGITMAKLAAIGPAAAAIAAIVAAGYGVYKFLEYAATPAVQSKRRMAELNEEIRQTQNELQNAQLMLENFASDYTRGEVEALTEKLADLKSEFNLLSSDAIIGFTEEIVESTEAQEDAETATDDHTRALKGLSDNYDDLRDAQRGYFYWNRDITRQAEDLVKQLKFENTEAGKLGVTIQDVGQYFIDTAGNMDEFLDSLIGVQKQGGDVNDLLNDLGISVDVFREKTEDATKSFSDLGEAIYDAMGKLVGYAQLGQEVHLQPIPGTPYFTYEQGPSPTKGGQVAGPTGRVMDPWGNVGNVVPGSSIPEGYQAYAKGGVVPGPIGEPQLAMVHGGEVILPPKSIPSVTITGNNFYVRDDRDIELIAERLVSKIYLRTGMKR